VVIALPPVKAPVNKTRQAYQTLDESHFTKGDRSAVLAAKIEAGGRVDPLDIYNVFDLVAEKLYPGIGIYKSGLEKASGCRFHLAGAGPALFALCVDRVEAQSKVISARGKGFRLTAHAFSHGSRFV
jgi:4-diphosphocytidyl-2C-methyl-D-erythritol kinase